MSLLGKFIGKKMATEFRGQDKSPKKQANREPETLKENGDERKWIAGIGIVLGIIFIIIVVRFFQGYMDGDLPGNPTSSNSTTITTATPITQTPSPSSLITNPEYLKNPSAYLIDSEDKMMGWSWKRQEGGLIWVEGVVDSHTLKVSYVMSNTESEEKILKVDSMAIPLLGDPSEDTLISHNIPSSIFKTTSMAQCWENEGKDFLQTHFLHTWIDLKATGWYLNGPSFSDYYMFYYSDGNVSRDLADYVIRSGYGSAIRSFPSKRYSLDNNLSVKYLVNLQEIEKVAYLAKRGIWSACYKYEK